jgi:two-component system CheB/CheR fusion protein
MTSQPLTVRADPARIEQIAMNLLSNAFKFAASGGHVSLSLDAQDDDAVLEVSDTGRGIRAEFLPYVFEMFRQDAGRTTARETGGLGIGLALVRDLVQLHGGTITAASAGEAQGATFTVKLPIDVPSDFAPLDSAGEPQVLRDLRVLLVDESLDTLESFAALMRLEGALVSEASSAQQALERAAKERFDLLISDIGMPGMDGYELITELRRQPAARALPAIAITGYGTSQDESLALEAGFTAHLSKPVDIHRLTALLVELGVERH